MKIFLTGATGLLGSDLRKIFEHYYELIPISSKGRNNCLRCDLRSEEQVHNLIKEEKPSIILHCAAVTNVDLCEQNPKLAHESNVIATKNLVTAVMNENVLFIYLSTDYVFNGEKSSPYNEFDSPDPINVYGITKLGGENYVTYFLKDYYIVRTGALFGENGKNFVKSVLERLQNGEEVLAAHDQFASFTYTVDLAQAILKLLEKRPPTGIYHIANFGYCSRLELALRITELCKKDKRLIKAVAIDRIGLKAERPKFVPLATEKFQNATSYSLRPWKEALKEFFKTIL